MSSTAFGWFLSQKDPVTKIGVCEVCITKFHSNMRNYTLRKRSVSQNLGLIKWEEGNFNSRFGGVTVSVMTVALTVIVCLPYYILLIHVHESKVTCSCNVYC